MGQKNTIIVSASIFRFLSMHVVIGFLLSLLFGLIWRSFIESIIIVSAVLVSAIIGFFLIDANEKNIVLDFDKIEGPTRSSIFAKKRISLLLKDIDLSLSKNKHLLVGNSYIASVHGDKILLDKKFLSDGEDVLISFNPSFSAYFQKGDSKSFQ